MSLSQAVLSDGESFPIEGEAPFTGEQLIAIQGQEFSLPCGDPWIHEAGTSAHAYIDASKKAWEEIPEWMDVIDLDSPAYDLKRAERDLYLQAWSGFLDGQRVLDVGCGVGRFTMPFLDRGATVIGVDPDLNSLVRCVWHAAARNGSLDVHWTSVLALPEVEPVDTVIVSEVLCYVPEVDQAMEQLVAKMKPGAVMLISMEARWGWAAAEDAPEGGIDAALGGDGVIDLPGDRWVQTYEAADLSALLERAGLEVKRMVPLLYTGDGPLEGVLPADLSLEQLIAIEDRCRLHPVWGPLNRAWAAVAVKRA